LDNAYGEFYTDEETSGDDFPDFDYEQEKVSEEIIYKIVLKKQVKKLFSK
jgi:hypothetical protein